MAQALQARTGGRILVDALKAHSVDTAFGVPGESYLEVLDAIHDAQSIRYMTCRHEAGAANMAEAYGKLTGRPGICFVTRGPGACHASIGVHIAHQDSTPMVMFVGQVPRAFVGREAFQEIDVEGMFGWTTKWAAQIDDPARIPEFVSRAFHTAQSGRPGPVVLAIPEDMQRETAVVADVEPAALAPSYPGSMELKRLHELLSRAQRPLLILGGGGWTAEACDDLAGFAKTNHIPTMVDFRHQDLLSNRHPSYAGDLAYAKDPKVSERLKQADFVLAVGTRLGDVTTEGYTLLQPPRPQATLVHVYPDANEIGRVYQPDLAIVASMAEFAAAVKRLEPLNWAAWGDWVKAARYDYLETLEAVTSPGNIDLYQVMDTVRTRLPQDAIVTLDAGNFSGWPQRFYQFTQYRTLLGPANGAMGYGVPAGIAAKLVAPDKPVVTFVGDGGFMMSGNELATAVHHGIAPVILVFNNGMYGTIRLHQEKRFPGRVSGTDLTNPDFAAMARSFGAFGAAIETTDDFAPAFDEALTCGRAAVLDLHVDPEAITTRMTLTEARNGALKARHGGTMPATPPPRPSQSQPAADGADQGSSAMAPPWQSGGSTIPSPATPPAAGAPPAVQRPVISAEASPQRASGPLAPRVILAESAAPAQQEVQPVGADDADRPVEETPQPAPEAAEPLLDAEPPAETDSPAAPVPARPTSRPILRAPPSKPGTPPTQPTLRIGRSSSRTATSNRTQQPDRKSDPAESSEAKTEAEAPRPVPKIRMAPRRSTNTSESRSPRPEADSPSKSQNDDT